MPQRSSGDDLLEVATRATRVLRMLAAVGELCLGSPRAQKNGRVLLRSRRDQLGGDTVKS
jgi:hypothetical protein